MDYNVAKITENAKNQAVDTDSKPVYEDPKPQDFYTYEDTLMDNWEEGKDYEFVQISAEVAERLLGVTPHIPVGKKMFPR